ncbi:MAG: undecaprenyl-diphosphate phosphatase [Phycisphaerae bacterium]|nr:undecaprenyl-diphosphate phosphatase [Phycisphaerae bacterium]
MTDLFKAVILGIIEGLTEFVPVSSTGHLVLAMPWLGIDENAPPWKAFLYFIQIGAILAVLIYFARPLVRELLSKPSRGWTSHMMTKIVIGVIPGGLAGVLLNDYMENLLEWEAPVAVALIVGGVAMWGIESRFRREEGPTVETMTIRQALYVGLAQCVAIVPGTSRSMATIMGGLIVGLPAATAAQFSFYLAIPILFGAGLLRVIKHPEAIVGNHLYVMLVGFFVSFVVAWFVVAGFMRYIQRRSLKPFAIYRILLGVAVLAVWLISG